VWTGSDAEQVEITDYHLGRGMTDDPLGPVHPGEVLREEFLVPLGITPYALAAALHVPRTRIERLVREETLRHRGHGFASGPVLPNVAGVLAPHPVPL
jgi:hypothetical protein